MRVKIPETGNSSASRGLELPRWLFALALLAACFLPVAALAQGLVLHGVVTDAKTNKPIQGAEITTVGDRETVPAHTESRGKFSLSLRTDVQATERLEIRVVREGYETDQEEEAASPNITISIQLNPKPQ